MVLGIFKMAATSGFLTALECNKFVFGRVSAPDPVMGAYRGSPNPLAGLRGYTSTGERRKGRCKGREDRGEREGKGEEGEESDAFLTQIPVSAPDN